MFSGVGGTIGRTRDNDWVIPDSYISGHHARIHFQEGRYFLEDTSTNGVFMKSPGNRLEKGRLYPLETGERIYIDAYEIHVTVAESIVRSGNAGHSALGALFGGMPPVASPRVDPFIPDDPFGSVNPVMPTPSSGSFPVPNAFPESYKDSPLPASSTMDPLLLLGLGGDKPKPAPVPRATDLNSQSPIRDAFVPPQSVGVSVSLGTVSQAMIPDDYDPLSEGIARKTPTPESNKAPRPMPGGVKPVSGAFVPPSASPATPVGGKTTVAPLVSNDQQSTSDAPSHLAPAATSVPPSQVANDAALAAVPSLDLHILLASAGVPASAVSPELAQNLGEILRVVVGGVMDVLRARERIKDEFRMRMTTFKTADNNPLKFSANVEDALYNLLVKRNAAYLGPVAAFEDGFQDIRNHQMAMLSGMRVAYNTLLENFDPERLQEQFDKQGKRGGLLAMSAKGRYWELYQERFRDMVKDPESSFSDLFGSEFARAYEEQLESLRVVSRNRKRTT